jgi:hypothetical protein
VGVAVLVAVAVIVVVTVLVGVSVTVGVSCGDGFGVKVDVGVFVGVGAVVSVGVGTPITGRVGDSGGVGELGCIVGTPPAAVVGVATGDVNVARTGCVERMRVAEAEGTGTTVTLPNGNNCIPTRGVAKSVVGTGANVGEMFD